MATQYLRRCSLVVANTAGNGVDLSTLRIRFNVVRLDAKTPNTCDIRVYNLSDATGNQLEQLEYTRVILQAGYQDPSDYGVIFDGTIKQAWRGRESEVDTYVDIFAAEGDLFYNFGVINQTLAAGYQQQDVYNAIDKVAKTYGLTPGATPTFAGTAMPRGRVLYGQARDQLDVLARNAACTWGVNGTNLDLIPHDSYVPPSTASAVVLNSATGLLGMPRQTLGGIELTCLLNPNIKIGGAIQINNKDIIHAAPNPQFGFNNPQVPLLNMIRITEDGFYRVLLANQHGDTRGNDWYTEITCIAINDPSPPGFNVKFFGQAGA